MKIFKKAALLAGSIGTVVAPVATVMSCGSSSTGSIDAGATIYDSTDTFMQGLVKDLKVKAGELKINMPEVANSAGSSDTQIQNINALLGRSPKVLTVNPVAPADVEKIITTAKENGVPLILFNKEAPNTDKDGKDTGERKRIMATYDKVWYVGTTATVQGEIQAQQIYDDIRDGKIRDLDGDGKLGYAILRGESGHADAIDRSTAVIKKLNELLKANPVKLLSVDGTKQNDLVVGGKVEGLVDKEGSPVWHKAWGAADGREMYDVHKSGTALVEAWFANNDGMATGVIKGLSEDRTYVPLEAGKDYKTGELKHVAVYGVDATGDGKDAIKSGWMNGTVLNDGKTQGYLIAELMDKIIKGTNPDTSKPYELQYDPWGQAGNKNKISIKNNADFKAFYVDSVGVTKANVDKY